MLGTPKPKESLRGLIAARRILGHDHGRMHVRIADPVSVRDFTHDVHVEPRQPGFVFVRYRIVFVRYSM